MQRALFHGPGRMCATLAFTRNTDTTDDEIKLIAAKLMSVFASGGIPENLHVLIAISASLIRSELAGVEIPTSTWPTGFPEAKRDLFIQVAADTEADRTLALRIIDAFVANKMRQDVDLVGGRLLNGQEHFGFADGAVPTGADLLQALHSSAASSKAAPTVEEAIAVLAGTDHGTWLFHIHFKQDLTQFFGLSEAQRADVVGRAPATASSPGVRLQLQALQARGGFPADSHWSVMARDRKRSLLRRGFPCRSTNNGQAAFGLSFVAACEDPNVFKTALSDMISGSDRLLKFIQALDASEYFCPPSASWLVSQLPAVAIPATVAPLQHGPSVTVYEVAQSFFEYINALYEANAFGAQVGQMKLDPALQGNLDQIHTTLETQANLPPGTLRTMQLKAEAEANAINLHVGTYLTVS